MRAGYDFSPLYRSMIGVDRMAELIETSMKTSTDRAYPPYDIEKIDDDAYRVTIATAGFRPGELEITAQPNLLIVAGRKQEATDGRRFLHQGLAGRSFEHRFELADYVVVRTAGYENGLLTIELAREIPEAMKPRRVQIAGAPSTEPHRQIPDNEPGRKAA